MLARLAGRDPVFVAQSFEALGGRNWLSLLSHWSHGQKVSQQVPSKVMRTSNPNPRFLEPGPSFLHR